MNFEKTGFEKSPSFCFLHNTGKMARTPLAKDSESQYEMDSEFDVEDVSRTARVARRRR